MTKKQLKTFREDVDRIMLNMYGITWNDASGEEMPLRCAIRDNCSPEEFVKHWGEKYDLVETSSFKECKKDQKLHAQALNDLVWQAIEITIEHGVHARLGRYRMMDATDVVRHTADEATELVDAVEDLDDVEKEEVEALRQAALKEFADVSIGLAHLRKLLKFTDHEVAQAILTKLWARSAFPKHKKNPILPLVLLLTGGKEPEK